MPSIEQILTANPSAAALLQSPDTIIREDGGWCVLFDRHSGEKLRVKIDPSAPPYRASVPEMVTLNIASVRAYANPDRIRRIISLLTEIKVLEVCIVGNGICPTIHPCFAETVRALGQADIAVHVVVSDTEWAFYNSIAKAVITRFACVVAFQCNRPSDVPYVRELDKRVPKRLSYRTYEGPERPFIMALHNINNLPLATKVVEECVQQDISIYVDGSPDNGPNASESQHMLFIDAITETMRRSETSEREAVPYTLALFRERLAAL